MAQLIERVDRSKYKKLNPLKNNLKGLKIFLKVAAIDGENNYRERAIAPALLDIEKGPLQAPIPLEGGIN